MWISNKVWLDASMKWWKVVNKSLQQWRRASSLLNREWSDWIWHLLMIFFFFKRWEWSKDTTGLVIHEPESDINFYAFFSTIWKLFIIEFYSCMFHHRASWIFINTVENLFVSKRSCTIVNTIPPFCIDRNCVTFFIGKLFFFLIWQKAETKFFICHLSENLFLSSIYFLSQLSICVIHGAIKICHQAEINLINLI